MRWKRSKRPVMIRLGKCEVDLSINGKKMGLIPVIVISQIGDGDTLVIDLNVELEAM